MDAEQPNHPAETPTAPAPLVGTEWRLTHHPGPAGELVPIPTDVMATAVFADGRVAGTTGCNRYHATYGVGVGPAISFGPVAATMMACDPEPTAVERAFTAALGIAATLTVRDGNLELADADGRVILRFRAAEGPALAGTRWVAIGINNGRGGVVSTLAGAEVTAVFDEDGRVTGSGGCNRFTGTYVVEGVSMTIGLLASTLRACLVPEGVGEQETAFFAALGRVASWSIREDRLHLRDAGGALQVDFRAAVDE
jgi:heat shock protein HslJ